MMLTSASAARRASAVKTHHVTGEYFLGVASCGAEEVGALAVRIREQ